VLLGAGAAAGLFERACIAAIPRWLAAYVCLRLFADRRHDRDPAVFPSPYGITGPLPIEQFSSLSAAIALLRGR